MAGRGRPPKPTALKLVEGNPGRRPLNKEEPQLPPGLPEPPDHLRPEGRREWARVGALLLAARVITQGDLGVLTIMCDSWAEYVLLEKQTQKQRRVLFTDKGFAQMNPIWQMMRQARADYLKAASELGLTPVARVKVKALPDQEKDEFEAFLTGAS